MSRDRAINVEANNEEAVIEPLLAPNLRLKRSLGYENLANMGLDCKAKALPD